MAFSVVATSMIERNIMSFTQALLVKSRFFKLNENKEKFTIPLQALIVIPVVALISLSTLTADHLFRLRFIYPFQTCTIGVLLPLYIIMKKPKMIKMAKEIFFNKPKNFLIHIFSKFKNNSVTPSV